MRREQGGRDEGGGMREQGIREQRRGVLHFEGLCSTVSNGLNPRDSRV